MRRMSISSANKYGLMQGRKNAFKQVPHSMKKIISYVLVECRIKLPFLRKRFLQISLQFLKRPVRRHM